MDNQNIIQTIIDKYIALKNKQQNNISYDEIPDLTIVTSYWFMRISSKHYASLMKSNTPNISTKEIENAVQNIQAAICAKFSDLFSKDFDLYTLHLIDNLYDKIDIINSEWKTMPTEHNCNTELIQQIQNLIQKAIELRDSLNSFKSKYKKQFSTKISEDLRPSYMNDIYEFSKQKRNDPIFYTQNKNDNDNGDKIWREFKESAKLLKEIIIDLQNILTRACW